MINKITILVVAILGISSIVYLVKQPKHQGKQEVIPRVITKPSTPLDEYTERLNKARIACEEGFGVLVIDELGNSACALLKNRWGV